MVLLKSIYNLAAITVAKLLVAKLLLKVHSYAATIIHYLMKTGSSLDIPACLVNHLYCNKYCPHSVATVAMVTAELHIIHCSDAKIPYHSVANSHGYKRAIHCDADRGWNYFYS